VKRISARISQLVIIFSALGLLSSCSWISSRRSLFGGDEETAEAEDGTVTKAQYNALAKKYEALLKERKMENVQGQDANNMMNQMEGSVDSDAIADEISRVKNTTELAETVDVFKNKPSGPRSLSNPMPMAPMSTGNIDSALIEDHIAKVRKAEGLLAQKKFDATINIIKELEKSPVRQVVVRAKFLMGEILFTQGDYDLAMQVFEEVLTNHAFSGLVIKTLGRLIVCADKLKIPRKQEKYYSILHDFFEQGA
jgi:TolA-binding protein